MKNFNYSIIIPHHNSPSLLCRCLESIPQREDLEIIVVDDNSDEDKKANISRPDVKTVFIDKEHTKGAGKARNVGMSIATGKWLLFADADDCYSDYLPMFLNKYADDNTTDIVYMNANRFDENNYVTTLDIGSLIHNYLSGKKYSEMNLRYACWTPWTRMVKRALVEYYNIKYDEVPAGNDVVFGLNCSKYSHSIKVEDNVVYLYFKSSKGSSTDKARLQMVNSRLDLRGRVISIQKQVNYKFCSTFASLFFTFVKEHGMSPIEAYRLCRNYQKKYNVSLSSDSFQFLINLVHKFKQYINNSSRNS